MKPKNPTQNPTTITVSRELWVRLVKLKLDLEFETLNDLLEAVHKLIIKHKLREELLLLK